MTRQQKVGALTNGCKQHEEEQEVRTRASWKSQALTPPTSTQLTTTNLYKQPPTNQASQKHNSQTSINVSNYMPTPNYPST